MTRQSRPDAGLSFQVLAHKELAGVPSLLRSGRTGEPRSQETAPPPVPPYGPRQWPTAEGPSESQFRMREVPLYHGPKAVSTC